MTDQADLLARFSDALVTRAEAAKNAVAAIRLAYERHITGIVWQSEIIVASEQSLPRKDDFELVVAGGSVVNRQDCRTAGFAPDILISEVAHQRVDPTEFEIASVDQPDSFGLVFEDSNLAVLHLVTNGQGTTDPETLAL